MGNQKRSTTTAAAAELLPSMDLLDPIVRVEREALKLAVQQRDLLPEWFAALEITSF